MSSPGHFSIVGSGRCGSTWLHHVLDAHPGIAMTVEAGVLEFLHYCANLANVRRFEEARIPPIEGRTVEGILDDAVRPGFSALFGRNALQLCERFYREHFADRRFDWWGEKLLDIRVALDLQEWLPDARFLVLARDPRDVLCSWRTYARKNAVTGRGRTVHSDLDAEVLARSWHAIYEVGAPRLRRALTLRYEDFIIEPEARFDELLAFIGLTRIPAMDAILGQDRLRSRHGTSESNASSVGRWQDELTDDERSTIESICSEPMRRLGYPSGR